MGRPDRYEQIVKKLRTASEELGRGKDLGEVCCQLEVSEATYHRWKKQYDGAQMETVKRLKELEKENSRFKKLVAEQALDMDMLKEINAKKVVGPTPRREAVNHLQTIFKTSERRACKVMDQPREVRENTGPRANQIRSYDSENQKEVFPAI